MSNELTDGMVFQVLKEFMDGYQKKIKLDQDLITTMPKINSFTFVEAFMKAVLREFEAIHLAQYDLMNLLYAMRTNDVKKFNEVKASVDRGEPYRKHLEGIWGYERQQADGDKI
jgi:hypothetical protein